MKVGLWNLEPKIENTALMQVSQYHKQLGDQVEFYSPLFEYDKVYVFSLFSFTKKPILKSNMVAGGTGFNIRSRLPLEIEQCNLDYSIYPKCKTTYLYFSRGCIRNCPFCVVPTSEGKIHSVSPKNENPNADHVAVMDNNFFANKDWLDAIDYLVTFKQPIDFQCGFDARIWRKDFSEALELLHPWKQYRTAWDNPKENLEPYLKRMAEDLGKSKIMVYVLIGYWSTPEEDLSRVLKIRELGMDAYVMPYSKRDIYQRAFERWCNRHANCDWKDYSHGEWKPELLKLESENE